MSMQVRYHANHQNCKSEHILNKYSFCSSGNEKYMYAVYHVSNLINVPLKNICECWVECNKFPARWHIH